MKKFKAKGMMNTALDGVMLTVGFIGGKFISQKVIPSTMNNMVKDLIIIAGGVAIDSLSKHNAVKNLGRGLIVEGLFDVIQPSLTKMGITGLGAKRMYEKFPVIHGMDGEERNINQ